MIPGEIITPDGTVELAPGRARFTLTVENAGDRPVQVGSHYHFAAANPALSFDREAARGFRLDIPAGTSVRFEPGVSREVALVELAGREAVVLTEGDSITLRHRDFRRSRNVSSRRTVVYVSRVYTQSTSGETPTQEEAVVPDQAL